MFSSILASTSSVTAKEFLICTIISIVLGIVIAFLHSFKNEYSGAMFLTLAILPAVVQTIIMLVNGNIGTGIAVMGAFSLIRFRSQPGNSREIASIFLATTVGLAMAMGYVGISVVLIVIVGIVTIVVLCLGIGQKGTEKHLRVTIPENLDYEGLFDDIFEAYTTTSVLNKVKTVNMGSLYELDYFITMKKDVSEKAFIDEIRCRNGNLNIILGRVQSRKEEL